MPRRFWIFGAALLPFVLVAVGVVVMLVWPSHDRDRECFEQLQVGMPEAEAVGIVTKQGFAKNWSGIDEKTGAEVMRFTKDESGNPSITIVFSVANRRVTEKVYEFRPEPGFFEWLQMRVFGH